MRILLLFSSPTHSAFILYKIPIVRSGKYRLSSFHYSHTADTLGSSMLQTSSDNSSSFDQVIVLFNSWGI